MLVLRSFRLPEEYFNSVLAIGNFDGVHIGHQAVILEAKKIARNNNSKLGILTFEPHPKCFFKKKFNFFRLTPFRVKVEILKSMGIDFLLNIKFDQQFVKNSAESFLKNFLNKSLKASHIVTGFDFVFGYRQSGDVKLIQEFSKRTRKFNFTEVKELKKNNVEISSSRIRNLLRSGEIERANFILTREWKIVSRVVQGKKQAREIGFKTANLNVSEFCDLRYGVYSVKVFIKDINIPRDFSGIANYGIKPTFDNKSPILEVHIFDFNEEIYGKKIVVSFVKFLREEKKFESIEKLKEQIIKDIEVAKKNE